MNKSIEDLFQEDFSEANVRNAIANVIHTHELGIKLHIPESKLIDIHKLQPEARKEQLVAAWFKTDPSNCNWPTLRRAMNAIKVLEWSTRRSMSDSFSEDHPLSPSSSGSAGSITGKCMREKVWD